MELSSANISIYQQSEDRSKPDLLRQTFSGGKSQLCRVGSDGYTIHVQIFNSTFNQPNSTYYVSVDYNFVKSQASGEPLIGIDEKIWKFSTSNLFFLFFKKKINVYPFIK